MIFPKTVNEHRKELGDGLGGKGDTFCECCEQRVHLYTWALNSNHARILIWIVSNWYPEQWIHVSDMPGWIRAKGGETARLERWKLLRRKPKEAKVTHKAESGLWQPTDLGIDLVRKPWTRVPKYFYTYNSKVLRYSDETSTIHDALGEHFDYHEVMRSTLQAS